jgi:hypothetical protein
MQSISSQIERHPLSKHIVNVPKQSKVKTNVAEVLFSNKIHLACKLGGRTPFRKHASDRWLRVFQGNNCYNYIRDLSKADYEDDLIF